jgi:hypothetical protein
MEQVATMGLATLSKAESASFIAEKAKRFPFT